jgi:hypothetical protein
MLDDFDEWGLAYRRSQNKADAIMARLRKVGDGRFIFYAVPDIAKKLGPAYSYEVRVTGAIAAWVEKWTCNPQDPALDGDKQEILRTIRSQRDPKTFNDIAYIMPSLMAVLSNGQPVDSAAFNQLKDFFCAIADASYIKQDPADKEYLQVTVSNAGCTIIKALFNHCNPEQLIQWRPQIQNLINSLSTEPPYISHVLEPWCRSERTTSVAPTWLNHINGFFHESEHAHLLRMIGGTRFIVRGGEDDSEYEDYSE